MKARMPDHELISRRVIVFAWGVQIVSAYFFLTLALLAMENAARTAERLGSTVALIDMLLRGLPLIVAATVEITKIPLVKAIYGTSGPWRKAIILGKLLVVCIISFQIILYALFYEFTQYSREITDSQTTYKYIDSRIAEFEKNLYEITLNPKEEVRRRQAALEALRNERTYLYERIARQGNQNHVYKTIMVLLGKKHPNEVTDEELHIVMYIWLGSFALLAAFNGTILAFAALTVKYARNKY